MCLYGGADCTALPAVPLYPPTCTLYRLRGSDTENFSYWAYAVSPLSLRSTRSSYCPPAVILWRLDRPMGKSRFLSEHIYIVNVSTYNQAFICWDIHEHRSLKCRFIWIKLIQMQYSLMSSLKTCRPEDHYRARIRRSCLQSHLCSSSSCGKIQLFHFSAAGKPYEKENNPHGEMFV